jgi:hypothetical protein
MPQKLPITLKLASIQNSSSAAHPFGVVVGDIAKALGNPLTVFDASGVMVPLMTGR